MITRTPRVSIRDLGGCFTSNSQASGINRLGWVVGSCMVLDPGDTDPHAWLWRDEQVTDLGMLPGYGTASGERQRAMRAAATTPGGVGHRALSASVTRPCMWRDGEILDLGTLGGNVGIASAINSAEDVVGWSLTASGEQHALLWYRGAMHDLNDLVGSDSGWSLEHACDLNDAGQIVGSGRCRDAHAVELECLMAGTGRPTPDRLFWREHAFLLTTEDYLG